MTFYAHENLVLVVDGENTWHTARALDLDIDWGKLRDLFARQATLTGAYYFTPMYEQEDGFAPVKRLVDWLDFNGWQTWTDGRDVSADMATAVMEMARNGAEHFVIASGNATFAELVAALKRQNKVVTILSALPQCSEDLRRAADAFLDLSTIRNYISRAKKETVAA